MASKININSKEGAEVKLSTPEEYIKKQKKKASTKTKLDRAAKKKEKAYDDLNEKFFKLKLEFANTLLPKHKKQQGRNIDGVKNLEIHTYVLELLRANVSSTEAFLAISEEFGLTLGSAKNTYYASIRYLRETIDEQSKDELKFILINKIESIQRLALTQGDMKTGLKAADQIAKLYGLYEPEKIEVKGDMEYEFKFPTFEEEEPTNENNNEEEEL
jgi:hypothetical protein